MKTKILLASLLLFCVSCKKEEATTAPQTPQTPTVKSASLPLNAGFEEGDTNWIIFGGKICPREKQSGNHSLYIQNDSAQWIYGEQYIKIPTGAAKMELTAWLKTKAVVQGKEDWERALCNFEFVDSLYAHLDPYPVAVANLVGTTPWTKYNSSYDMLEGAHAIKLHCALGNATGQVWFDNLKVQFSDSKGKELSSAMIPKETVFSVKGPNKDE